MTGGGGLAGIDVADNDDVDVSLLLLTAMPSVDCALGEEAKPGCRMLDRLREAMEGVGQTCESIGKKLTYPMVTVLKWLLWKVVKKVSVQR